MGFADLFAGANRTAFSGSTTSASRSIASGP